MAPRSHAVLAHATLVLLCQENYERKAGELTRTVAPQRGSSGSMASCSHAVLALVTLGLAFGRRAWRASKRKVGELSGSVAPQRGSSVSMATRSHTVLAHATSVLLFGERAKRTKRETQKD